MTICKHCANCSKNWKLSHILLPIPKGVWMCRAIDRLGQDRITGKISSDRYVYCVEKNDGDCEHFKAHGECRCAG